MISASIQKYGRIIKIELDGHAEYDNTGRDIVCAAVSSLCVISALIVKKLELSGMTDSVSVILLESGSSVIIFSPRDEYYGFVLEKLEFLHLGLSLIAEEYPANLNYNTDIFKERKKQKVYAV